MVEARYRTTPPIIVRRTATGRNETPVRQRYSDPDGGPSVLVPGKEATAAAAMDLILLQTFNKEATRRSSMDKFVRKSYREAPKTSYPEPPTVVHKAPAPKEPPFVAKVRESKAKPPIVIHKAPTKSPAEILRTKEKAHTSMTKQLRDEAAQRRSVIDSFKSLSDDVEQWAKGHRQTKAVKKQDQLRKDFAQKKIEPATMKQRSQESFERKKRKEQLAAGRGKAQNAVGITNKAKAFAQGLEGKPRSSSNQAVDFRMAKEQGAERLAKAEKRLERFTKHAEFKGSTFEWLSAFEKEAGVFGNFFKRTPKPTAAAKLKEQELAAAAKKKGQEILSAAKARTKRPVIGGDRSTVPTEDLRSKAEIKQPTIPAKKESVGQSFMSGFRGEDIRSEGLPKGFSEEAKKRAGEVLGGGESRQRVAPQRRKRPVKTLEEVQPKAEAKAEAKREVRGKPGLGERVAHGVGANFGGAKRLVGGILDRRVASKLDLFKKKTPEQKAKDAVAPRDIKGRKTEGRGPWHQAAQVATMPIRAGVRTAQNIGGPALAGAQRVMPWLKGEKRINLRAVGGDTSYQYKPTKEQEGRITRPVTKEIDSTIRRNLRPITQRAAAMLSGLRGKDYKGFGKATPRADRPVSKQVPEALQNIMPDLIRARKAVASIESMPIKTPEQQKNKAQRINNEGGEDVYKGRREMADLLKAIEQGGEGSKAALIKAMKISKGLVAAPADIRATATKKKSEKGMKETMKAARKEYNKGFNKETTPGDATVAADKIKKDMGPEATSGAAAAAALDAKAPTVKGRGPVVDKQPVTADSDWRTQSAVAMPTGEPSTGPQAKAQSQTQSQTQTQEAPQGSTRFYNDPQPTPKPGGQPGGQKAPGSKSQPTIEEPSAGQPKDFTISGGQENAAPAPGQTPPPEQKYDARDMGKQFGETLFGKSAPTRYRSPAAQIVGEGRDLSNAAAKAIAKLENEWNKKMPAEGSQKQLIQKAKNEPGVTAADRKIIDDHMNNYFDTQKSDWSNRIIEGTPAAIDRVPIPAQWYQAAYKEAPEWTKKNIGKDTMKVPKRDAQGNQIYVDNMPMHQEQYMVDPVVKLTMEKKFGKKLAPTEGGENQAWAQSGVTGAKAQLKPGETAAGKRFQGEDYQPDTIIPQTGKPASQSTEPMVDAQGNTVASPMTQEHMIEAASGNARGSSQWEDQLRRLGVKEPGALMGAGIDLASFMGPMMIANAIFGEGAAGGMLGFMAGQSAAPAVGGAIRSSLNYATAPQLATIQQQIQADALRKLINKGKQQPPPAQA